MHCWSAKAREAEIPVVDDGVYERRSVFREIDVGAKERGDGGGHLGRHQRRLGLFVERDWRGMARDEKK